MEKIQMTTPLVESSFHYNMRNTLTISCFHLTIKRILFQ